MATLDFESDRFLELLTDALRAGPGSPQWHEAIARLRNLGAAGDEYRLLCAAREHLESGKEYRSVRAGPEFTRRIMLALEQEEPGTRRQRLPLASLIAIVSAIVVLIVVGVVVVMLIARGGESRRADVQALSSVHFVRPMFTAQFDGPLGEQWRAIGALRLDATRGLRPVTPTVPQSAPAGGGIVWTQPLDAAEPVAIEVTLRVNQHPQQLMAQVFVTDQTEFDADRATASRELAWSLTGGQASVILPGGSVEAQAAANHSLPRTMSVRILVNADHAIIETDGKVLWSGEHHLPARRARYIGLRFLSRGDGADIGNIADATDRPDALIFQSIRVLGVEKQ